MSGAPLEPTAQAAWERTLGDVVEHGTSVGTDDPSSEILGYSVGFKDARHRVGGHPERPLPIVSAVARFVWMMAGSDRLADILFYEPKVKGYSDDGLAVPGSNYGARLRNPSPGIDQVIDAIGRIGESIDRGTTDLRRAANVIWMPGDAGRDSDDIPCAFGVGYFPRAEGLHTELIMRSNNAVTLMPFNVFEFSLLAEVVAVETHLKPGPVVLHAMSMHIYDGPKGASTAKAVLSRPGEGEPEAMPAMPSDALEQINVLARAEAKLRHSQSAVATQTTGELRQFGAELNAYWRPFLEVLLVHHLTTVGRGDNARNVADELPEWARPGALAHVDKVLKATPSE